jgi:2-haloacid dehalogenase
MPSHPVVLFDVNETLTDLAGIRDAFAAAGADPALAAGWFAGVLRDGFALTITGRRPRFAELARAGLGGMMAADAAEAVLNRFSKLELHPDVAPGVRALVARGIRVATLSNGAASVAEGVLTRAGIRSLFEALLSVDDAPAWKPDPRSYRYAAATLGVAPADLVLVAVHPWDLDGARAAGLRAAWVNRSGARYPDVFAAPDHTVDAIEELAGVL